MKPLYWTRIQIPVSPPAVLPVETESSGGDKVIWEQIEDVTIKEEEFDDLFSRLVAKPKEKKEKKSSKPKVEKPSSILDPKRGNILRIM